MVDRYSSFEELAASEQLGKDYCIREKDRRTPCVILAPHGGKIEPGTSEIAEAIAGTDLSFYAFEALRNGPHGDLHITSHLFDEPRAIALVGRSHTAIAIHGRRDDGTQAVWWGGRAIALREAISASLCDAGFKAVPNERLPGCKPTNICNRTCCHEGVQLELPRSLRQQLMRDADLLRRFCEAIRKAIQQSTAS